MTFGKNSIKIMKQIFCVVIIISTLISITSCDRRKVFEAYRKIDKKGWNKDSVVVFKVHLSDTVKTNNLYINIRNKGDYPYSNIYLFLSVSSPNGVTRTDTIEFTLADPSGRWRGSGVGGLYDNRMTYKSSVFFPHKGDYKFSIKQGMRDNMLQGIRDVGFRIEKTK
jgi:gliding motility-associated lipoprotein GldH